jgi:small subunit ribosomal protein S7
MSRRKRSIKRTVATDPIFNDLNVAKFINCVMREGKKSTAERIVYTSIDETAKKVKKQPLETFYQVIKNVMPVMEVKSRRVGGSTYQVPVEVREERGVALAMRWIINNAKARKGHSMIEKLSSEMTEAFSGQGASIKKKEDTHKMAESNKAFAHFRW